MLQHNDVYCECKIPKKYTFHGSNDTSKSSRYDEPRHETTNNVVSEQVRHTPACTVTEDGYKLEILDLESRGIVLSV